MRQSLSVSEFAQQREAKKEFAGRDKERRQREGMELSSRTARDAFRKYIRTGQTHRRAATCLRAQENAQEKSNYNKRAREKY